MPSALGVAREGGAAPHSASQPFLWVEFLGKRPCLSKTFTHGTAQEAFQGGHWYNPIYPTWVIRVFLSLEPGLKEGTPATGGAGEPGTQAEGQGSVSTEPAHREQL